MDRGDVIVAGPGLGRGEGVTTFVRELPTSARPLVLDADALNAFADEPALLEGREGRDLIITPHPGEMARLVGCTVEDLQVDRIGIATDFAKRHKLYVVLKGYRTIIVTPDEKVFVNPTGCPGMATGGTGDVLAGMLGAWLAQLLDAEAACKLAVYLHGSAGELADADNGEVSMTAGDLVEHIGDAILELTARRRVAVSKGRVSGVAASSIFSSENENPIVDPGGEGPGRVSILLLSEISAPQTAFVRGLPRDSHRHPLRDHPRLHARHEIWRPCRFHVICMLVAPISMSRDG